MPSHSALALTANEPTAATGAGSKETLVDISISLLIQDDPAKPPAWGYVLRQPDNRKLLLGISLNRAAWPAANALAVKNLRTVSWLCALALADRMLSLGSHPSMRALQHHLARMVLGHEPEGWELGLWLSVGLSNHSILTEPLSKLPIYGADTQKGPFPLFHLTLPVDFARLAEFFSKPGTQWIKGKKATEAKRD
jgi:hypothetical protein